MPMTTLGDLSQLFQTQRDNVTLRTRLDTLTRELSTGQKSDLTRSLGSDSGRFAHIDRRLDLLASYTSATNETAQVLAMTQQALSALNSERETLSADLLTADFSASAAQRDNRMIQARASFNSMVEALNTRFANRFLLSGAATDGPSVASANDMITDIEAAVSGLTTRVDIEAALDTWFDDPTGGFATMGYIGDAGNPATSRIDETETVTFAARADNEEIRAVLKATVKSFIANGMGLNPTEEADLMRQGGLDLASAGEALIHLSAQVGFVEARVEDIGVRHDAETTSLGILRNEMTVADPYDTAAALQELQVQLETHYALTARLSRLSLAEFLR